MELYLHSPSTPSRYGAQLKKKHKDTFTFTSTPPLMVDIEEILSCIAICALSENPYHTL
jgi:hypothetical protein